MAPFVLYIARFGGEVLLLEDAIRRGPESSWPRLTNAGSFQGTAKRVLGRGKIFT